MFVSTKSETRNTNQIQKSKYKYSKHFVWNFPSWILFVFGFSCFGFLSAVRCLAVIVYTDPGRLDTAPTGKLANAGWQYEGNFFGFTGTAIAPNYFITAAHIGGGVGQGFLYNGAEYITTAFYDDPNSDLRIWKVDGTLPAYATIDAKKNEVGKQAIIFGRGTDRGDALIVKKKVRGWEWGAADDNLSWGTNRISSATKINGGDNVLAFKFSASKSKPDEATISEGDSGGGVFVKIGKSWELAGVNFTASGPYSLDSNPADEFNASLFNAAGFYTFTSNNQPIFTKGASPTIDYATRLSTESVWINRVLSGLATPSDIVSSNSLNALPEPAPAAIVIILPVLFFSRRRCRYTAGPDGKIHCI